MTISPEDPESQAADPTLPLAEKRLLDRYHYLPFVLPFAVFSVFLWLQPSVPVPSADKQPPAATAGETPTSGGATPVSDAGDQLLSYPLAYVLGITLTGVAVLIVLPIWRQIPWRCSWWAVAVGLLGGILWIGICHLKIKNHALVLVGLGQWASLGARPSFDPFTTLGAVPVAMVAFLVIRFVGLAVIVPLTEEFFLRGFLMRFVEKPDWWTIDIGTVGRKGAWTAAIYGVLAHPAEPVAAALWFSLITLLHARTRSIWDCVVAHGITNATMMGYILMFRDWTLW